MSRIEPTRTERGYRIGEGMSYSPRMWLVNPSDRSWTRHSYVLWFGACGATYLRVWSNSLEDALEECAGWLADHAPGYIMAHGSPEHIELIEEACAEAGVTFDPDKCCGCIESPWDDILQSAETDLTYTESGFITSYEWGIALEDPSRSDLESFLGR